MIEATPLALVVDDDEHMRRVLARILKGRGFAAVLAPTFETALDLAKRTAPDLAVVDVGLPDGSGIDLAREIRRRYEHTALLVQSADDDPAIAELAVEVGALGYLIKPFARNEFLIGIGNVIARQRAEHRAAEHAERLRGVVASRTAVLEKTVEELERSRSETIHRLARAIEFRDPTTGEHIERIGSFAALLAEAAGLAGERVASIRVAAPLHDVGKLGIPDSILLKPGPLTPTERRTIKRHAEIGHAILAGSGSPLLELAASIALTHHERVDGHGYPHKLRGEEIPLEGRIVAIVDVFDALISERPYREAMTFERAVGILREGRGTQFDPDLLDLFLDRAEDFRGA